MADEDKESQVENKKFSNEDEALYAYVNALREFGPHNDLEKEVFRAIVKQFPGLEEYLFWLRSAETLLLIELKKMEKTTDKDKIGNIKKRVEDLTEEQRFDLLVLLMLDYICNILIITKHKKTEKSSPTIIVGCKRL